MARLRRDERGDEKLGGSRTADAGRLRTFMGIATGLWLVAAIAAITDREALMAVLWFCFVGYGALFVGGAVGRSLQRFAV